MQHEYPNFNFFHRRSTRLSTAQRPASQIQACGTYELRHCLCTILDDREYPAWRFLAFNGPWRGCWRYFFNVPAQEDERMDKIDRAPSGHRCGQSHQKAKLTDDQVREMRKAYMPYVVSFAELARRFGCSVSTANDICSYRTRINII